MPDYKILLVDDDPFIRELVGSILTSAGYDVSLYCAVDDAIEAVESQHFDLVMTDIVMPGKTGLDFMKHIRAKGINVPVLAITGGVENAVDDYLNAADMYADMALPKPIVKDDVLAAVANLVKNGSGVHALQEEDARPSS